MPDLGLASYGGDGGMMDRDFGQGGPGPLGEEGPGPIGEDQGLGVNPGDRLRNVTQNANLGPDLGQSGTMMPETPGPSLAGRTPLIGMARRERGLPVIRDQVPSLMD
jgi:hypothetical protein